MRYIVHPLLLLFATVTCLTLSPGALAQTTGSIQGRITDAETGQPLPGANVLLVGTMSGAIADADGYYYILNIPPGKYDVRASMVGFGPQVVQGFDVHLNESHTLDFVMREETIMGQEVVVEARTPTVKLDVSSSRTLITAQILEQMPVANFEEVLASFPGISLQAGSEGTGLVIRGGNINETNIVVDGLSTRDMRTQQPNTTLNLTAVNELEVISGGFTAEHGGIRSGMVNVVTREGDPDRYRVFADIRIAPPQKKHFGPSPYSTDGPWWKVYAGPDAMTGITQAMVDAGGYPFTFIGWNEFAKQRLADGNPETDVTPQEALEIWKWQHRPVGYAQTPDYVVDVTLTGPVPALKDVTFMAAQRYDDLQLAYPLSRNNSIASSTLLKLTAHLGKGRKISFNNGLTQKHGVGAGMYSTSIGVIDGTRQGTSFARNSYEWDKIWQDAALNPISVYHYRSGLQFNNVISARTFYEAVAEFTTYRTRQQPEGVRDTTCVKIIAGRCYDEAPFGYVSSDIGRISETYDILNQFLMSGGGRGRDNSSYWTLGGRFALISQMNPYYQVKAGADIEYASYRERREVNHEASTHPYEERPQYWTRFDAQPVNASAYVQNKLEFRGMIANVGVRADYMYYGERAYNLDPEFIFNQLPYTLANFTGNELSFDSLQTGPVVSKFYLSPRLGVSHPITTMSKVYFNYGHFYQPPVLDQLYTVQPNTRGAIIPNLKAAWPRTISYELGFEVGITQALLVTFAGYYKDVQNQLSVKNIVSRDGDNNVQTFDNNSYADTRGIEMRLQMRAGSWFQGWGSIEYSTRIIGFTGFRYIYEDRLLAREQRETINQQRQEPVPSISANLTFTSPNEFGPRILSFRPLAGWRLSINQSWSDGGRYLSNPDARVGQRRYVDAIDWYNTDAQVSRSFRFAGNTIGMYAQVTNLTNYRGFPNPQNFIQYTESLRFPWYQGDRQGNDRWGEWNKDHINLGYHSWNQFINPRQFSIGLRMYL